VSQVLAELSFAVERTANAPAAVKEIEKRAFSAILVDCDDSVSGKVVFEAARRSDLNKQAPAVAIVSGRSGLPTAFRLGAGFVVTKPASLDQARHALRAATSRIKKDSLSSVQSSTSAVPVTLSARAAAASASASPNKDLEPRKSGEAASAPKAELPSAAATSTKAGSPAGSAAAAAPARSPNPEVEAPKSNAAANRPTASRPSQDDPVLADLDDLENPLPLSGAPYSNLKLNRRTPVLALVLVLLLLAGAGGYAAFLMSPSFRNFAWAQYVQARIWIGKPLPQAPAATRPAPPAPIRKPVPQPPSVPEPAGAPAPATSPEGSAPETPQNNSLGTSPSQPAHTAPSGANPQH
jgi:hypothetical protein